MLCTRSSFDTDKMGQSASSPLPNASFEGKDLFDLSDGELRVLMKMRPWTRDEVLVVAKSLVQFKNPVVGFYSIEDDSPETDMAIRLNALSQELGKLRFSLVPSRVKEPVFWESVFTILKERLVEHNARFKLTELEKSDQEGAATSATSNGYHHDRQPSSPAKTSSSFPDDEVDSSIDPKSIEGQLAAKDMQIAALQRQVQELQAALESMPKPVGHKGKWLVSQDSQDFISYPEEVKENMRREKQKRLRQVQQDMKFILDSDRVEDSNGHWQCCGETTYNSTCLKSKSRR